MKKALFTMRWGKSTQSGASAAENGRAAAENGCARAENRRAAAENGRVRASGAVLAVAAVSLISAILAFPAVAAREVGEALRLCAEMLIPSLFPLTVASELAMRSGATGAVAKPLARPISKLLGVGERAAEVYILGLVGGYTASCRSAVMLFERGELTRRECESIIALSSLPSVGFVVGFVGSGLFGDARVGWWLWGITVASTVLLGAANRALSLSGHAAAREGRKEKPLGASALTVRAISGGAQAMLLVCGCVVFFSVVGGIACEILPLGSSAVVMPILEITGGTVEGARLGGRLGAAVCAACIGHSGLCVHCQIIALTESAGLNYRKYFALKILQGAICAALALATFPIFKI